MGNSRKSFFYIQNPKDGLNITCFDVFIRGKQMKIYPVKTNKMPENKMSMLALIIRNYFLKDSMIHLVCGGGGGLSAFSSSYLGENIIFAGPNCYSFL